MGNLFRDSIDSGSFSSEYEQGIDDDITYDDRGIGDGDEFLGKEEATFGEIIASPFILLGIVCTLVGIIWLLFLRTTIENKYPSYLVAPSSAASSDTTAVEMAMVPQSSAASGGTAASLE